MERSVPYARTSVILALDVSGSMCSTDVKPNRLAVAQEAARAFVENQPKGVRMGLVVFSGFAELTVPPTTDRKALVAAIESLTVGRGTAIGAAMLKGLDAIAEVNPAGRAGRRCSRARFRAARRRAPGANGYVPDIVVLLTDGANNRGIEPLDAVPYAVERRVRVYTIGFGTETPRRPPARATSSAATSSTPRVRRRRRRRRVRRRRAADSAASAGRRRADPAGGREARPAARTTAPQDADQLRKVFADLPRDVATQKQRTEITWIFAALGALLAAAAIGASMRWSPYP